VKNDNPDLEIIRQRALKRCAPSFERIQKIAEKNTLRVLRAFQNENVGEYHFHSTSGYGYRDPGRECLDRLWAAVFGAEKALVRNQFVSGTHAIACVLFGNLRAGDHILSLTGQPYDTLQGVIGSSSRVPGCLRDLGIEYDEVDFSETGLDTEILASVLRENTRMVLIQRSCGYRIRPSLSVAQIGRFCKAVKKFLPDCITFVDNCYGEFVDVHEPCLAGADIIAGSLIKNPGGGLAATGAYIAGKTELVEKAACRLTVPGIGGEMGASLTGWRLMFQGLFFAPHAVAEALKSAVFAAAVFSELGYKVIPDVEEERHDIIQAIVLGSPEKMLAFCRGLQQYSPVDARYIPEPALMPGYTTPVIMAGGTFVQGSSIEMSADGPMREPYAVYYQGGLAFEHSQIGIMGAAAAVTGKAYEFGQ